MTEMKWWAQALDEVIKQKGSSKAKLEKFDVIPRRQIQRFNSAVNGPTIGTLERVLTGLGATWHDWAKACDMVMRQNVTPLRAASPPAEYKIRAGPKQKKTGGS